MIFKTRQSEYEYQKCNDLYGIVVHAASEVTVCTRMIALAGADEQRIVASEVAHYCY